LKFQNVSLLSVGYVLPPEVITSIEIESRLAPIYERLKLPEGRLEGMSGIKARRLWSRGTRISDVSARSARLSMEAAGVDPKRVIWQACPRTHGFTMFPTLVSAS